AGVQRRPDERTDQPDRRRGAPQGRLWRGQRRRRPPQEGAGGDRHRAPGRGPRGPEDVRRAPVLRGVARRARLDGLLRREEVMLALALGVGFVLLVCALTVAWEFRGGGR